MWRAGLAGVVLIGLLAFPLWATAGGSDTSGGAGVQFPSVREFICDDGRVAACSRGQSMTIRGEWLSGVKTVSFLGGKGAKDDRKATVISRSKQSLDVIVPISARTGPVRVKAPTGQITGKRVRVTKASAISSLGTNLLFLGAEPISFDYSAQPGSSIELVRMRDLKVLESWPAKAGISGPTASNVDQPNTGQIEWDGKLGKRDAPNGRYGFRVLGPDRTPGPVAKSFSVYSHIFPVRGRHDFNRGPATGFGGGRGHQGHDVFASCGTQLVAARGGVVIKSGIHSRAGNYVVIKRADGQSYAYMHLRKRPLVREGERVKTGQDLGEVGDTGRASGCHLHFELWTAPGYYLGGKPIDPISQLKAWDSWS